MPTNNSNRGVGHKVFGAFCWKEAKKVLRPHLKLKLGHNVKYTQSVYLACLIYLAVLNTFPAGGLNLTSDLGGAVPDSDTVYAHLHKFNQFEVEQIFRKVLDDIYRKAKAAGAFRHPVVVAIDCHDIPYYGKKRDKNVVGGKHKNGTDYFHRWMTACVVDAGERITIGYSPVSQFSTNARIVADLLAEIKRKVNVRLVLLDRGFHGVEVISILKSSVDFIVPAIGNSKIAECLKLYRQGELPAVSEYEVSNDKKSVRIKLVIVEKEEVNDKGEKETKYIPFFTNVELTAEQSATVLEMYHQRWGIETSYRLIEDFLPKTCSNEYPIRTLFFLLAASMYNIWILCNMLLGKQRSGEIPTEPVLPVLFLRLLCLLHVLNVELGIDFG